MKANLIKILAVMSLMLVLTSPTQAATVKSTAAPHLAAMPLMFIEQQPNRYQVHLNGQSIWFSENEMWLTIAPSPESGEGRGEGRNIKLTFQAANPQARLEPINKLETHLSNFKGNDPAKWQTDIPVYSGVRYHDLYPNTDLIITSEQGKLAWQWETVGAGLVPARVADSQTGQTQSLSLPGNVRIEVDNGTTAQTLSLDPHQSLTDQLAAIIDPQTADSNSNPHMPRQAGAADLVWSTFLGGTNADKGNAIVVDSTGNVYLTGYTNSSDFPTTAGAFNTSYNGTDDVFVAKLNSSGTALIYATFLGGGLHDKATDIALDDTGNVYLTGSTASTDFPATTGAYDTSYGGGGDIFVAKLNSKGSALIYATFLGGTGDDESKALVLDGAGNVILTGYTDSSNFPITAGAYDTSYNGGEYGDIFVVKLNNSSTNLIYATFLGGTDNDEATDLALDGAGNVILTGYIDSTNFPTTAGAYDTSFNGGDDAFVAKLNSSGTTLIYATFLGGAGLDNSTAIATDSVGNIYLTGYTNSTDFPTTVGSYDTSFNGGFTDAFVAKLNSNGTNLSYATFLGGTDEDKGYALALDSVGNIILTGRTWSANFPITNGAYDTSFNGGFTDAFVAKLSSGGTSLSYATFLGGKYSDTGNTLALDSSGNIYMAGFTDSTDFPTTNGAYDTNHNGYDDVFISKLSLGEISTTPTPIKTVTSTPVGTPTSTPTPTPNPTLQITPTNLKFNMIQGSSNPASQLITINSKATTPLTWTANSDQNWLSLSNLSGTVTTTAKFSVTVNGSNLALGTYSGKITVGSKNGNQAVTVTLTVDPKPSWTLMFYMAADNDAGMEDALQREYNLFKNASSNKNVNLVVFWDGLKTQARYDVFLPDGTIKSTPKGELNTGDPTTLENFVLWAQQNYPAPHYALTISDHGNGIHGVAIDKTSIPFIGDVLTPKELRQALSKGTKLDLIYMQACLMGNIESAYQMRGLADYYVASEAIATLPYKIDFFIPSITQETTPESVALTLSDGYFEFLQEINTPGNISVIKLANIEDVVAKTSILAGLLKTQMATLAPTIREIKSANILQHFDTADRTIFGIIDYTITDSDYFVDLYHFASLIKAKVAQPEIQTAAQALMDSINTAVIPNSNHQTSGKFTNNNKEYNWNHENSHGISIYFPSYSHSFYKDGWLDFTAGTTWNINKSTIIPSQVVSGTIEWGPMLVEYVRQTDPNTPDDPNPPALVAPLIIPYHDVYLPLIVK